MNFVRVMTALCGDVWLINPQVHRMLTGIVWRHIDNPLSASEIAAQMPAKPPAREYQLADKTAIIPIDGVIGRKFANVLYSSGVTSIDILDRILTACANDDQVENVLMVIDSPGGYSRGVPESSALVSRLAAIKPVFAYIDGQMCSAAYWLAAGATAIYATPSADVGSIGAYIAILDESRAAEMAGYKLELFKSGPYKGMGVPGTALTDAHREYLQAEVDRVAGEFKAAVQAGRARQIADEVMQGQSFHAAAALENGLIDSVASMEQTVADLVRYTNRRKEMTK